MAVRVTASHDVVDVSTGLVVVPKGTAGQIVQTFGVPAVRTYNVTFTLHDGSTVTRFVSPSEIDFDDGELGPVRAYYEGSALTITSVAYTDDIADFEQKLSPAPVSSVTSVDIRFSDGTGLRVVSDRNSGEISFELI